jgi:hypothetical protein
LDGDEKEAHVGFDFNFNFNFNFDACVQEVLDVIFESPVLVWHEANAPSFSRGGTLHRGCRRFGAILGVIIYGAYLLWLRGAEAPSR